jgi:hypothetical protein
MRPVAFAAVVAVVLIAGMARASFATSGSSDPLAGIRTARMEVKLGGGLGHEPSIALELFGGDRGRAASFEAHVATLVRQQLAPLGIRVLSPQDSTPSGEGGSEGWVVATFFGRPERVQGVKTYVYLAKLEVGVTNPDPLDKPGAEMFHGTWERTVIGLASERDLEGELCSALVDMFAELGQLSRSPHVSGRTRQAGTAHNK